MFKVQAVVLNSLPVLHVKTSLQTIYLNQPKKGRPCHEGSTGFEVFELIWISFFETSRCYTVFCDDDDDDDDDDVNDLPVEIISLNNYTFTVCIMGEDIGTGLLEGCPTKSGVPIEHLDYRYIGECKNGKELEKILRVLRWVTHTCKAKQGWELLVSQTLALVRVWNFHGL